VIVHWPILLIESFGGFLSSSAGVASLDFFFDGFVQYFSNMPSLNHFFRDRSRDSAITRLFVDVRKSGSGELEMHLVNCCSSYLSDID